MQTATTTPINHTKEGAAQPLIANNNNSSSSSGGGGGGGGNNAATTAAVSAAHTNSPLYDARRLLACYSSAGVLPADVADGASRFTLRWWRWGLKSVAILLPVLPDSKRNQTDFFRVLAGGTCNTQPQSDC